MFYTCVLDQHSFKPHKTYTKPPCTLFLMAHNSNGLRRHTYYGFIRDMYIIG